MELAHRLVGIARQSGEGRDRRLHVGERRVACLHREAGDPAQRRSLVAVGIVIADQQADPQRVLEADRRQLAGRRAHERQISPLERPAKPSVR